MGVNVKAGVSIHNMFKIVARNAQTLEIEEEHIVYNIVLERCYSRLCNFQSYFDNIVFGTGSGTPSVDRSTLFNRLGHKSAVQESLVRDYPTSIWTKKCTLGTEEYNGNIITEIGISNETTNVNTHAMIADSEGNPLSVEKTSLRIIDLYATVFVNVYDVDSGLFFYGNGLRDYLTGSGAPGNTLGISYSTNDDDEATINGTKVVSVAEKLVTISGRFNVDALNKDVKYLSWKSLGLRCKVPRVGVFTSKQINGKQIGVGDGVKKDFLIPNVEISNIVIYVDGVINNDWTYDSLTSLVTFGTAPGNALIVTADYLCSLFPKTVDNVLDVVFKIKFEGAIPTPVVPPVDYSTIPGAQTPVGGDSKYGFYGEVSALDFISGADLCTEVGLTAGTLQNSDAGWLKFAKGGTQLLLAKKTFRHSVSWNDINAVGAVFGKPIKIGNDVYTCRLLSTVEWNELMYPIHKDYGQWAQYTDAELLVHSTHGNGSYSWTSTPSGSSRVSRGRTGVSYSFNFTPSASDSNHGFRPVLEFLYTLPSGV